MGPDMFSPMIELKSPSTRRARGSLSPDPIVPFPFPSSSYRCQQHQRCDRNDGDTNTEADDAPVHCSDDHHPYSLFDRAAMLEHQLKESQAERAVLVRRLLTTEEMLEELNEELARRDVQQMHQQQHPTISQPPDVYSPPNGGYGVASSTCSVAMYLERIAILEDVVAEQTKALGFKDDLLHDQELEMHQLRDSFHMRSTSRTCREPSCAVEGAADGVWSQLLDHVQPNSVLFRSPCEDVVLHVHEQFGHELLRAHRSGLQLVHNVVSSVLCPTEDANSLLRVQLSEKCSVIDDLHQKLEDAEAISAELESKLHRLPNRMDQMTQTELDSPRAVGTNEVKRMITPESPKSGRAAQSKAVDLRTLSPTVSRSSRATTASVVASPQPRIPPEQKMSASQLLTDENVIHFDPPCTQLRAVSPSTPSKFSELVSTTGSAKLQLHGRWVKAGSTMRLPDDRAASSPARRKRKSPSPHRTATTSSPHALPRNKVHQAEPFMDMVQFHRHAVPPRNDFLVGDRGRTAAVGKDTLSGDADLVIFSRGRSTTPSQTRKVRRPTIRGSTSRSPSLSTSRRARASVAPSFDGAATSDSDPSLNLSLSSSSAV